MLLLIFSLSLIAYYALHSILANNTIKSSLQHLIPSRFYRLFFNGISIVFLIGLVLFFKQLPVVQLFEAWPKMGLGFMVLGGILMIGALAQYDLSEFAGWHQLQNKGNSPEHSLNQKGLNKYIRHPLYTANFLIFIGFVLYYPVLKSALTVGISSMYLIIGTRLEEQKLVAYFGNTYRKYQQEVGRFLPKF